MCRTAGASSAAAPRVVRDGSAGEVVAKKQRPWSPNIYVAGPGQSTRSLPILTRVEPGSGSTGFLVPKMPVFRAEPARKGAGELAGTLAGRGPVLRHPAVPGGEILVPLGTYRPARGTLRLTWKPSPLGGEIPPMGPEWVVLDVGNGTLTRGATPATERFYSRFAPAVLVQR